MRRIALTKNIKTESGFTLIEVMVAIVILMVGMLGLLQSVNVVVEYNLKNHLRDEAVTVGEKYMNEFRGENFDTMTNSYANILVDSKIRSGGRKYTIEKSSQVLASDSSSGTAKTTSRQLQIVVKWSYKGQEFQNRVISVISKAI